MMNVLKSKKGSIIVESALLLPLLSLLMVGLLEFGRILMIKESLTNAAREAARVAALELSDEAALASATTVANDYMSRSGLESEYCSVTPVFTEVNGSDAVSVTVSFTYGSTLSHWIPGIPSSLDLRSAVTMRREA